MVNLLVRLLIGVRIVKYNDIFTTEAENMNSMQNDDRIRRLGVSGRTKIWFTADTH